MRFKSRAQLHSKSFNLIMFLLILENSPENLFIHYKKVEKNKRMGLIYQFKLVNKFKAHVLITPGE